MITVELRSRGEDDTHGIGVQLGRRLRRGDVVTLSGDLGAGKTRFAAGMAEGLGLDPRLVSSPTFVMVQEYGPRGGPGRLRLVHVDAYRIGGDDDLETVGWHEFIDEHDAVVAVEWPERIAEAIPALHIAVTIRHPSAEAGAQERTLRLSVPEALAPRIEGMRPAPSTCPSCGRTVGAEVETAPFCSERCRLADLGDWFAERHRITGD